MSALLLQINEKGSWRNVMQFDVSQQGCVEAGAKRLFKGAGGKVTFRQIAPGGLIPKRMLDSKAGWRDWGTA